MENNFEEEISDYIDSLLETPKDELDFEITIEYSEESPKEEDFLSWLGK